MRKVLRALGILLSVVVLAVAGIASYVKFALPDVGPPPALKVQVTPARVARGEHLARYEMQCLTRHSPHDETAP